MNKERLKQRMESMQSSMEIAKYLDESPNHFIPILLGASKDEIEKIKDDHRLSRAKISHFLNSIVLEIAIKIVWELDKGKNCRNTHDIYELYNEIDPISQSDLRNLFYEKARILADIKGKNKEGTQRRLGELVQFQSWKDTLRANRDIMVNFKYDGEFTGNSSAMGTVMWNNHDTLWILPPLKFVRFPEAVYLYTLDRVCGSMS